MSKETQFKKEVQNRKKNYQNKKLNSFLAYAQKNQQMKKEPLRNNASKIKYIGGF